MLESCKLLLLCKKTFIWIKVWVGHSWRERPSGVISSKQLVVDPLHCSVGGVMDYTPGWDSLWPLAPGQGNSIQIISGCDTKHDRGFVKTSCALEEQMYLEVENASIFPLKALVLWHDCSKDVLVECQGLQGCQEPAVLCAKTNGHMQLAEK